MGEFIIANWLQIILIAGTASLILILISFLRRIEAVKWLMRQEYTYLELVLPRTISKNVSATEQLFSVLHGLPWIEFGKDRLLGRSMVVSTEIVAERSSGLRFYIRVQSRVAALVKQQITGFLPTVKINETTEPLINTSADRVASFRQTGHFAYPLRKQDVLADNDPMSYLTAAMAQLENDEQIAFQLVLSPAPRSITKGVEKRLENLSGIQAINNPFLRVALSLIVGTVSWIIDLIEYGFSGSSNNVKKPVNTSKSILATNHNELTESARRKLNEPLFIADLRVRIVSNSVYTTKQRLAGLKAALTAFNAPRQTLKSQHIFAMPFSFMQRLPALMRSQSNILSATEIASIYHFPYSSTAQPENLVKSLSRTLPAPVSLKQTEPDYEVILGENVHHGAITPIGLGTEDRARHMYCIGATGSGKTTALQYMIVQDILAGRGVGVLDPHGDLAEKLLQYIPEERMKDVVYFNPDDIDYPIGINLLEIDPSVTGSERLKLMSKTTEVIIEAFRKAFSEDGTGGHRIESVLRNGVLTAMTVPDATLFTIQKLLRNTKFRNEIVGKLNDQRLVDFWDEELGKAGDMQRVSMTKGVTMKLDRLQLDPIIGRIFGQTKSTINFSEILDGKIFICNLSKKIGPDNSNLLGTIILSLINLAAEGRADTAEEDRKPFYLYVDEFQNFATSTFTDMVAEARKYRLYLTMAEQTTSQQDRQIVETILGNVGVMVSFRTGNPADERMLTPFFHPFIEPGEIHNLPPYNYYVRLAASAQEPFSGRTIVLPHVDGELTAQNVKNASRKLYAREYVEPPIEAKPVQKKANQKTQSSGKPQRQRYMKK